jgi:hypothetical protein
VSVPVAQVTDVERLATVSETLLFIDGSVACQSNGRWFVYVQACERDGQAGEFIKRLKHGGRVEPMG